MGESCVKIIQYFHPNWLIFMFFWQWGLNLKNQYIRGMIDYRSNYFILLHLSETRYNSLLGTYCFLCCYLLSSNMLVNIGNDVAYMCRFLFSNWSAVLTLLVLGVKSALTFPMNIICSFLITFLFVAMYICCWSRSY